MHLQKASRPATDKPDREPRAVVQAGGLDNRKTTSITLAPQGCCDNSLSVAKISMRQKRGQAITAAIALLAETFPKCFSVYEGRRCPLKLNIHLDIQAALDSAITPAELHRALGTYCSNPIYLGHTRTGAWRLDLNGEPAGVVTADEEAHARETLARIRTKQKTEPRPRLRPRLKLRPLSGRPSLIRKLLRSRGNTRSIKPMEGIMRESKTQRPAGQGGSKLEKKQSDNRFSSKNLKSEQLKFRRGRP